MPQPPASTPVEGQHLSASSTPPSLQDGRTRAPLSAALDRPSAATPKYPLTRCYWTLLSADLSFTYVDPTLASDLDDQGDLLLGRCLFDFVHPKELVTARNDLGNVLGTRELHGSITRVLFAGLSRIRRLLAYPPAIDGRVVHDRQVIEEEYHTADIVVNWAAEGVVLCFLHFVPEGNSSGGPCGASSMDVQTAHFMYQRLLSSVPQPENVTRIFQLLWNAPERQLLVSWPPDRNQGLTSNDFVKIAQQVHIGSNGAEKTACIRRYKATRTYGDNTAAPLEIESVFIPHGTIIFACHKVHTFAGGAVDKAAHAPYATNSYGSHPPYYPPEQYSASPLPAAQAYEGYPYQTPAQPPYDYQPWSSQSDPSPQPSQYSDWSHDVPSPAHSRGSGYSASSTPYLPSFPEDSNVPPPRRHRRSPSPYGRYGDVNMDRATESPAPMESSSGGKVPRRTSPSTARENSASSGTRGMPPAGITMCSSCKATLSPEWRKGPSGKKDLCNACGLRYARSKAKKDGPGSQRRKKSTASLRDDAGSSDLPVYLREPPSAASTPDLPKDDSHMVSLPGFRDLRRASIDLGSYGRFTGPGMHGRTPSPSPPANMIHFTNYSYRPPAGDLRYAGSNGAYYDQGLVGTGLPSAGGVPSHALPRLSPLAQYPGMDRELPAPSSMHSSTPVAAFDRRVDDAR